MSDNSKPKLHTFLLAPFLLFCLYFPLTFFERFKISVNPIVRHQFYKNQKKHIQDRNPSSSKMILSQQICVVLYYLHYMMTTMYNYVV